MLSLFDGFLWVWYSTALVIPNGNLGLGQHVWTEFWISQIVPAISVYSFDLCGVTRCGDWWQETKSLYLKLSGSSGIGFSISNRETVIHLMVTRLAGVVPIFLLLSFPTSTGPILLLPLKYQGSCASHDFYCGTYIIVLRGFVIFSASIFVLL